MNKRFAYIVLALILALSMIITSCSNKESGQSNNNNTSSETSGNGESEKADNVNPAGQFPIVKKPITMTCLYVGDPRQNYKDNGTLKLIAKETGITLDLVVVPSTDYETKKNLMMATGDYPEIFLADINRSDITKFGIQEKIFIPLDDLIDKYGSEIKSIFAKRPGYDGLIKSVDGHVYVLPRFSECGHCMAYPKLWFNYAWLDKLGLKEPQTTDELYDVLKAIKEQDPNGNGKQDEIPLTGAITYTCPVEFYLMNSFIECDVRSNFINISSDGKASFCGVQPEFKEGLKYIKKLYDDGLIDKAAFTQNDTQMQQTVRQKPTIVAGYTADHLGMGVDPKDSDTYPYYHALPPVAGPQGVRVQPYTSPEAMILTEQPGRFAITDKCKNPAAAFRLADYLLSERMTYIQHFGLEGQGWQTPPEGTKDIYGNPAKVLQMVAKDDKQSEEWAANQFWGILGDLIEVRNGWCVAGDTDHNPALYESRLELETQRVKKYWDLSHPDAIPDLPLIYCSEAEATEYSTLKINIIDKFKRDTIMFITGQKDIDKDWDAYINEMKGYGLDRWLELYQKGYDKFKEVTGVKG